MSFEFRPATAAEMPQLGQLTAYVYGGAFGDEADNLTVQATRPEWTLCAFDGPTMVASYATLPFTMRANGPSMPLGGVTVVGTQPEYRRRGLLRAITERAFASLHEARVPVAALWASQAAIYQRYGFSQASSQLSYAIDTVDIRLLQEADSALTVTRIAVADGLEQARQTYRTFIAPRMLYLHRSQALWRSNALQTDTDSGPVHLAIVRDPDDQAVGYVAYTLRDNKIAHAARTQELIVRDLAWLSLDAYRALWSFFARHDLVGRVAWPNAPRDDPAGELLAEPRLLHARAMEGAWLRMVDVAEALRQRGYDSPGELSIRILPDPLAPWNEGTHHLRVTGGDCRAVEVTRTDGAADITLTVKALASVFSGFHNARTLAAWGLLTGTPEAIRTADALFATRHAPHCPDHF